MHGYGKVILFGEHAVVYGYPALAASINLGIRSAVKASETGTFQLYVPSCNIKVSSEENTVLARVYCKILDFFMLENNQPCEIQLETEIPLGAGLGSSAATSVAIIRALEKWFRCDLGDEKINQIAFAAETIFHGTPSGIDNTIACFGGFCHLRDATMFSCPENMTRELNLKKLTVSFLPPTTKKTSLLVVNTKKERKTKDIVAKVRSLVEENSDKYHGIMQRIGNLAIPGYEAIANNDLVLLGQLMTENQKYLSELMVSSPEIDYICEKALQNGALGAKLTGAGGGGCVIVLTEPENDIVRLYQEKGFDCFYAKLG